MSYGRYGYGGWAPYVPAAKKKANAAKSALALAKKQGRQTSPVLIEGRKIATTFWGLSWCSNLEAYSDFANRLPRGATYVRNGSVVDLVIKPRLVEALVAGSETYTIKITIEALPASTWKTIKQDCSASIDSLLDLLAGRFSDGVMQRLTRQKDGLFPSPQQIKMKCSCPDFSDCCKHLAAVMYGIGSRLDKQPELLFLLRGVDHQELVSAAVADGNLDRELAGQQDHSLAGADLGAMFGIELETSAPIQKAKKPSRKSTSSSPLSVPAPAKKVPRQKSGTVKLPAAVKLASPAPKKPATAKKTTPKSVAATPPKTPRVASVAKSTATTKSAKTVVPTKATKAVAKPKSKPSKPAASNRAKS